MSNQELYQSLCDIRDDLNREIVEANTFCRDRNDFGQTHRSDDPHELISYNRGKSVGLIISRDKINNLIKSISPNPQTT